MSKVNAILIDVLAATDAVFRPMRASDWVTPAPSNLLAARQRFAVSGVILATGGGDVTARKQQERTLAGLAADGLVELHGAGRGHGVRLTSSGDAYARSLCGLPSVATAHAALQRVILLSGVADGKILTSELSLCGLQNYTDSCQSKLWEVSLTLAPALSRGWVESRSDVHGRAYYTPTDAGLDAATEEAPAMPEDLPAYNDEANEHYHEATVATRAALRTQKPSNPGEVGPIPLPASLTIRKVD